MTAIKIRSATLNDRDFLLSLVPRFFEQAVPLWRDLQQSQATIARELDRAIHALPQGEALLIAENETGESLGFIYLKTVTDFFTQAQIGHVSDVAIIPAAEGLGVGKLLMQAGEDWAKQQGYSRLTLHALAKNERARRFYEKLGYQVDWVEYAKLIE